MELKTTNYHSTEANREYVSVSQIKSFLSCPAKTMAELNGEYIRDTSEALLQGQYMDALFDGTLPEFERENNLYKKNGAIYAYYDKTLQAYHRIKEDKTMWGYCNGGEHQVIMTGEIQGVPVKIMVDNLHPDIIIDRKFMKDFNDMWVDGAKVSFAEAWGYDLQAAVYQTVVYQNTGKRLPFALACASKETVTDIGMFVIGEETIANALGIVRANIQRIQATKQGKIPVERCECCDHCVSTKQISNDRKDWVIL